MSRAFSYPIIIQKWDEATEEWSDVWGLHSRINKAKNTEEFLSGGAIQAKRSLVFEVRYFKDIEDVAFNTQLYRIMYGGIPFNISDYDDYLLQHKTVRLLGECY